MKESISKASDHIKPCNIAQSEQHNKRDEDYIKSLNPKRLYIRTDLTRLNETYTPSLLRGISLQDYYDWLKDMVKKTWNISTRRGVIVYVAEAVLSVRVW